MNKNIYSTLKISKSKRANMLINFTHYTRYI